MEHISRILNSPVGSISKEDICPNCGERIHYQYLDFQGERLIFRCRCEMEKEKERVEKEREAQRRQEILRRFANSGLREGGKPLTQQKRGNELSEGMVYIFRQEKEN